MKIIEPNDTTRASYVETAKDSTIVYGVFYYEKLRHVARYIPYKVLPQTALCGYPGSWINTRGDKYPICAECEKAMEGILNDQSKRI